MLAAIQGPVGLLSQILCFFINFFTDNKEHIGNCKQTPQ